MYLVVEDVAMGCLENTDLKNTDLKNTDLENADLEKCFVHFQFDT